MTGVIGDILPLAVVVGLSPIPIIAEILLLVARRSVPVAAVYLLGFVVGVSVVLVVLVFVAGAADLSGGSGPSKAAAVLRIVLGVALLVAALRRFRGRPKAGEEGPMPAWMAGIADFGAGKSLLTGLALGAINPKNLVVGVAAAIAIASAGLTAGEEAVAIAVYVTIGALGVIVPLLATIVMGRRADGILDGWKTWLAQNNATVMAVLFLVFGLVLIGQGIGDL